MQIKGQVDAGNILRSVQALCYTFIEERMLKEKETERMESTEESKWKEIDNNENRRKKERDK